MFRLYRRTQRRESMLLFGSLPSTPITSNGAKVLGRRYTRKKTITDTTHRFQKNRLGGIVFNVAAQTHHEIIDSPGVCILTHSPHLLQQFLARDDAALIENQVTQQVRFHEGEPDCLVRSGELERSEVDGTPGKGEGRRGTCSPLRLRRRGRNLGPLPRHTPQKTVETSQQDSKVKRLRQIIVGPGAEPIEYILGPATGGEHEDGNEILLRS